MNSGRGWRRGLVAAALGFWMVGTTPPAGLAQDAAEVLSASFRKAAQRVQPAVVAVRALEGSRLVTPVVPPGYFPPGQIVPPVVRRAVELDREPGGSGSRSSRSMWGRPRTAIHPARSSSPRSTRGVRLRLRASARAT